MNQISDKKELLPADNVEPFVYYVWKLFEEYNMPKPLLREPFRTLENQLYETMMEGHKQYRPDLSFPESASDMQACTFAILRMFEIKRRPIGLALEDIIDKDD